ncbi:uncharacterized protein PHALS_15254 [Plasmopara halstedii]|uniref:Uncharacterized protein n=1 Tax=Plasmopara halstedii TaxID=4781 RepID=A0A0P1B7H1_PLAHL|nr:uncharacterized protein PHALS_15254 [Plasmopara halstedii]CEG50061.1 hypothetical protein PHALS_15254 [Plasmopara halstedii]|eukprot:XP_024586430.1 hypothetical protein PHALS_15254 [Plasmopara halstedii]
MQSSLTIVISREDSELTRKVRYSMHSNEQKKHYHAYMRCSWSLFKLCVQACDGKIIGAQG